MATPTRNKNVQSATPVLTPVSFKNATASVPHFMSVDQVAQTLSVSTKTVRRAIKDRRLSATRFGRRVLISQGALQQFMTTLITAGWSQTTAPRKP